MTVYESDHIHVEGRLEAGMLVEVVENRLGAGLPLEINHHSDSVPVGFVPQATDAFDLPILYQLGDAGEERGFVYLVRKLRGDNLCFSAVFGDLGFGPHYNASLSGGVAPHNLFLAVDKTSGWEIRAGNVLDQIFHG